MQSHSWYFDFPFLVDCSRFVDFQLFFSLDMKMKVLLRKQFSYIFIYIHAYNYFISYNWEIYTKIFLPLDKVSKFFWQLKVLPSPNEFIERECLYGLRLSFYCRRAQDTRQNQDEPKPKCKMLSCEKTLYKAAPGLFLRSLLWFHQS